jgi:lipoprotein-releasing system permease protein
LGLSFLITHTNLIYVPAEIYHINRLPVDLRFWDVTVSILAALLLCFFSTLAPARRAARLNPVEGLRV